jgi:hypothetical protein
MVKKDIYGPFVPPSELPSGAKTVANPAGQFLGFM